MEDRKDSAPRAQETESGLEIKEGDNRWWIMTGGRGNITLSRVATTYDKGDGSKTTDVYEINTDSLSGNPLSVNVYEGVQGGVDLSTPITSIQPKEVVRPGNNVVNKAKLQYLALGPIRHLQEWSSPESRDLDRSLEQSGVSNFRHNLGRISTLMNQ